MADKVLDVRGMPCPYPIVKARKAILEVPFGGLLEVLATDPGSQEDFVVFAGTTGHVLIAVTEEAGVFRFILQRAPAEPQSSRPSSAT